MLGLRSLAAQQLTSRVNNSGMRLLFRAASGRISDAHLVNVMVDCGGRADGSCIGHRQKTARPHHVSQWTPGHRTLVRFRDNNFFQ